MKIEIGLKPFTVPNYVLSLSAPRPRQEGFSEGLKFPLADLEAEDLVALCDQFRHDVFLKAGKVDPAQER